MAGQITFLLTLVAAALVVAQNSNPENGDISPENGGTQPAFNASDPQPAGNKVNNQAGGSGGSNSYQLSLGGEIAIIVVVVIVALLGIGSAVLFYVAKKRQWEVRATIRRASRRVASKVDLRPASRRASSAGQVPSRGTIPKSPKSARPRDLEKGDSMRSIPMINTRGSPPRGSPPREKPRGSPPREKTNDKARVPAKEIETTIDNPSVMPAGTEPKTGNGSRWKIGGRS